MRSRYLVREPNIAHFITCTVVQWLPVFTHTARFDILIDSLQFSREKKGLKIYSWVILDNHFHAILAAPDLARVLMELKRYTALKLIEQVKREKCDWLLHQLAFAKSRHKRDSDHQFWQEGSHAHALAGDAIMERTIDYIHNNPIKRGLVAGPEHWRYSSAHEWLAGAIPVMKCDRWQCHVFRWNSRQRSCRIQCTFPNGVWERWGTEDEGRLRKWNLAMATDHARQEIRTNGRPRVSIRTTGPRGARGGTRTYTCEKSGDSLDTNLPEFITTMGERFFRSRPHFPS